MTSEEIDQLGRTVQRLLDNTTPQDLHDQRQLNAADVALYDLVQLALRAADKPKRKSNIPPHLLLK